MKPEELFIVSAMESFAMLLLWSSLENKLRNKFVQKVLFILCVPTIGIFVNHFSGPLGTVLKLSNLLILAVLLFRISIFDLVFEFVIVILLTTLLQMLGLIPIKLIMGSLEYTFINGMIGNTLFIIQTLLIKRYVPLYKIMEIYREKLKWASISILNTFVFLFILLCIWSVNKNWISENLFTLNILSLILITTNITAVVYGLKTKQQQKIIETYQQYNPIINNLIDEVKRRQHDFKNHLQVIYALTQTAELEKLPAAVQKYIQKVNSSIHHVDTLIQVENKILASLLHIKSTEAQTKNIKFIYSLNSTLPPLPMEDYELVEVLGNLIDNAFEAPIQPPQQIREVILCITEEQNHLIFEVKNNGIPIQKDLIKKIFTKGFSTKAKENRGFGLYNVKLLVEKHHGIIEVFNKDGYTSFKLTF